MPKLLVRMYALFLCLTLFSLALPKNSDAADNDLLAAQNGSFESPSVGAGFEYKPVSAPWVFSGPSGIQGNGSAWGAPTAPFGNQTAFLQSVATISQTINFAGGNYTMWFVAAHRAFGPEPYIQKIAVRVDGTQICLKSPDTGFKLYLCQFTVAAGSHTITFASIEDGERSVFLDGISIWRDSSQSLIPNGSFELPPVGNDFVRMPDAAGWIFNWYSGIQGNGSALNAPSAPSGIQTAFLISSPMWHPGKMSTTFNVVTFGEYSVSFQAAQSAGNVGAQQIMVSLDGVQVALVSPSTANGFTSYKFRFSAAPGQHTLAFEGAGYPGESDIAAFIDAANVSLEVPAASSFVYNPSFEVPFVGSGFSYRAAAAGWSFTGQSGIQGNGSSWNAASAPDGTQTAFLQSTAGTSNGPGRMSTAITLPNNSQYTVSFQAARRGNNAQQVKVSLDGVPIGLAAPASSSYTTYTFPFAAAAGAHTLSFEAAVNSGDNSAFVDAVNVTSSDAPGGPGIFDVRWAGFLSSLDAANPDAAAKFIVSESRESYRQVFIDLGTEMRNISANLSGLSFIEITQGYVRAVVTQNVNGQSLMRFITFVRRTDGRNGEWVLLDL